MALSKVFAWSLGRSTFRLIPIYRYISGFYASSSIQNDCFVDPFFASFYRVTSVLHLLDPTTLAHMEVPPAKYWRHPIEGIMTMKDLVQFEVLDIEEIRDQKSSAYSDQVCVYSKWTVASSDDQDTP